MRFYRDRPDIVTQGRWCFCPPGAGLVPMPHAFGSEIWDDDKDLRPPAIGEVGRVTQWSAGIPNSRLKGNHHCGTPDEWRNGLTYANRVNIPRDCAGVPLCCGAKGTRCSTIGLFASSRVQDRSRSFVGLTASAMIGPRSRSFIGLAASSRIPLGPRSFIGLAASAVVSRVRRSAIGLFASAEVENRSRSFVGLAASARIFVPTHTTPATIGLTGEAVIDNGDKRQYSFVGLSATATIGS